MPIDTNETPEGRARNDRIEFNILRQHSDGSWYGGTLGQPIPTAHH